MYQDDENIVAIATPPGVAALAVIRISGKNAFSVVSKIIEKTTLFESVPIRFASNQIIINEDNSPIDEVIILKYKSPKTFTGEDLVEIISHGGYYTVNAIMQRILQNGATLAKKGEFTKRAFLNGKIDLIRAESIKEIIESRSQEHFKNSINSYYGYEKKFLIEINKKIETQLAYIEADIEFGEEDLRSEAKRDNSEIKSIIRLIANELKIAKDIRSENSGITISIIGPTNAGKSSFFNYLLGYARVIVSETPGTTRDIIKEKIIISGKEVCVHDTAGFRISDNEIEKTGIKNTKRLIKNTDILIWITDAKEDVSKEEIKSFENIKKLKPIIILNKYEGLKNKQKEAYYKEYSSFKISIRKNTNLDVVIEEIKKRVSNKFEQTKISHISFNERKNDILEGVIDNLKKAEKTWDQTEIAAHYIKQASEKFCEIYGKNNNDDVINKIFDTFCIGK